MHACPSLVRAGEEPGIAAPPPTRVAWLSLSGLALKERRPSGQCLTEVRATTRYAYFEHSKFAQVVAVVGDSQRDEISISPLHDISEGLTKLQL